MSDEKSGAGAPSRLTELAQGLNRIDGTRYPVLVAAAGVGAAAKLPPHLIEQISTKKLGATK
jgi:hypothetical protein